MTTTSGAAHAAADDLRDEVARLQARVAELEGLVARVEALEGLARRPAIAPTDSATLAASMAAADSEAAAAAATGPSPAKPVNLDDPLVAAHDLLRRVLALASRPESDDPEVEEGLFLDFLGMVHTERKGTPMVESSLRQYGWRQLRRNIRIYLRDPDDVGSYDVARRDPMELTPRTERVKFFLRATTRMPAPIGLRRDASCGNEWRVETTSL